jgi:hypothetical protein
LRDYGRVYTSFWQSPEVRAMSEDARTLAFYLLTCPHANLIGCFRLPNAYAADDLQWPIERVREGFAELLASGFASRDEATQWVLIPKYIKWNAFENANVAIAAQKAFDQVPAIDIKSLLAKALLDFGAHLKEPFAEALRTLLKPFANPEPEPEPIRNQSQNQNRNRRRKDSAAAASEPASAGVWVAYSGVYASRYGAQPVRNAKVNKLLCLLVERLGADEAPHVAAFYVSHQNRLYVSAGHAVDLLVRDAEKLRTEWATNRQVTATQAMQADKTQTNFNAFAPLLAAAQAEEDHAQH